MDDVTVFNVDHAIEQQDLILDTRIKNYIKSVTDKPINKSKTCCDCDGKIGEGRLKALPEATRCIGCATDFENRRNFKKGLNNTRGIIQNIDT